MNIINILNSLSKSRPVFHSEADFQHSLAWAIHQQYPQAIIRLEYPKPSGKIEYVDLWIKRKRKIYGIELKYKTRKIHINFNKEDFYLLNQGAQDIGRYDFIKDIVRVEGFVNHYDNSEGWVILLTNDSLYYKKPKRIYTIDSDFRIHEGKTIKGNLNWAKNTALGTMHNREKTLNLKNEYNLKWQDYSNSIGYNLGLFRFLLLSIKK